MRCTMAEETRILQAYGLSPEEWAVLFTVSYHTPLPAEQVVELARLELPGRGEAEMRSAVERCRRCGWLATLQTDEGIVLTEEGLALKSSLSEDLMATVIQATPVRCVG